MVGLIEADFLAVHGGGDTLAPGLINTYVHVQPPDNLIELIEALGSARRPLDRFCPPMFGLLSRSCAKAVPGSAHMEPS
jgi:hypothetical protein